MEVILAGLGQDGDRGALPLEVVVGRGPIKSLFLLSPACCLIVRPDYTAPSCPTVVLTTSFTPVE